MVKRGHEPWNLIALAQLIHDLSELRQQLIDTEEKARPLLQKVHPAQLKSGRNLVHYLAMRRADLRPLQTRLTALGLSSLGRSEAHVMATLDAILRVLHELVRKPWPSSWNQGPVGFEQGRAALKTHTLELLGPKVPGRWVRIMATMPSDAADSPELVRKLLEAGVNCIRINSAHDSPMAWRRMVRHLRTVERQSRLKCRVLFDLEGPKLRTGPLTAIPALRWKPQRDSLGKVTIPARIWMTPAERPVVPPKPTAAVLALPRTWLRQLGPGDVIQFVDARKSSRKLKVTSNSGDSRWAECRNTAYVTTGTELILASRDKRNHSRNSRMKIGSLPERDDPILLRVGDTLLLTRKLSSGRGAILNKEGKVKRPARIGCTASEVFAQVRPGERVWFDDGKIGAVIKSVRKGHLELKITHARAKGEKLHGDKGINFPDSKLRLPSLSRNDLRNLSEIARDADLVGYSFVQTAHDVEKLRHELARLKRSRVGLILKVETRAAFEHLPELLLSAMQSPSVGVMIARGDLAVECGFERMAEVQEEILWLCEAAHVPVIWATQVLEKLSRAGLPTRAEVTDAAMGARAECVMLNKGPEMVAAVHALHDILGRMQAHQNKKQSMLRSLKVARDFRPVPVPTMRSKRTRSVTPEANQSSSPLQRNSRRHSLLVHTA